MYKFNFKNIYKDISLNVISPIILGLFLYSFLGKIDFIKNYLPDGLWAYSFSSSMLIIWKRRIVIRWIICVFATFFIFELLQYIAFIDGVGDILDIMTYFIFSFFALIFNKYFLLTFEYK